MKVYQQAALGHLAQASYGMGITISKAAWPPTNYIICIDDNDTQYE
jgi:hypothetical protein